MSQVGMDFLSLPAHDLERLDLQGTKLKLGDCVSLKVVGFTTPSGTDPAKDLALDMPAVAIDKDSSTQGDVLFNQGWQLQSLSSAESPLGELRFKACPIQGGNLTLPSLGIYRKPEGIGKSFARTQPLTVQVEAVPQAEQPAALKAPLALDFPWILGGVGVLALLAVLYGLLRVYRKWKASRKPVEVVLPIQPNKSEDQIALMALADLEQNSSLALGKYKEHYFRLSEIGKAYVGARFKVDAVESTTREMLDLLRKTQGLSEERVQELKEMFDRLDQVKFTDHLPLPDEGFVLLRALRDWVKSTRRAEGEVK